MLPPPFKCVGGKAKMVGRLREFLPAEYVGYAEPFVGGGALFRSLESTGDLDHKHVILSDLSEGTIRTWLDIQRALEFTEEQLLKYEYEYNGAPLDSTRKAMYLSERAVWNSGGVTGARHIFLRRLAFNGLWRENKSGGFNVPWSRRKRFTAPAIRELSAALDGVSIDLCPFEETFRKVGPGWVVYVDPPYFDEFSAYTRTGFSTDDHTRLLQHCADAKARGVHVIYSNRWTNDAVDFVRTHWPSAEVVRAVRQQTIAAKSTARGAVEEMIAT